MRRHGTLRLAQTEAAMWRSSRALGCVTGVTSPTAPLPLQHNTLACDDRHLASQVHHWRRIFDPELPHALHTAHQANEALCHAGMLSAAESHRAAAVSQITTDGSAPSLLATFHLNQSSLPECSLNGANKCSLVVELGITEGGFCDGQLHLSTHVDPRFRILTLKLLCRLPSAIMSAVNKACWASSLTEESV